MLVVVILVLVSSTSGDDLPFREEIVINNYEDLYTKILTFPVYMKRDSTIEIENRTVRIGIHPKESMRWAEGERTLEDKDFFLKIWVSIALVDTDFESYLNCWYKSKDQLFWDHAGEARADKAGEPFGLHDSLIVEDDYFKVTLKLVNFKSSTEQCGVSESHYLDCYSDFYRIFYMDSLTLGFTIAYSPIQEDLKSQFETGLDPEKAEEPETSPPPGDPLEFEKAVGHETKAADFFSNEEYQNAISEYQQARAIYDRFDDRKKIREIQTQIDLCNSYITAEDDLEKGIKLFQDAGEIEDREEAIKKYEEARSLFESTKDKYSELGDTDQFENCQEWINECNDQISNLTTKIKTETYLTIGAMVAVVVVGGAIISLRKRKAQDITVKKEKTPKPQTLEETQPKPQVLTCPLCKNEIQEDWALCPHCGVRLKDDTRIY